MRVINFLKQTNIASRVLFLLWVSFEVIHVFSEESKLRGMVSFSMVLLVHAVIIELCRNAAFDTFWNRKQDSSFWQDVCNMKAISVVLFFCGLLRVFREVDSNFLSLYSTIFFSGEFYYFRLAL